MAIVAEESTQSKSPNTHRNGTRPRIAGKYDAGYFTVSNAIADLDLPPFAKLVHFILLRHVNRQGQCFPSLNLIAEECGISRQSVWRALKCLVRGHMWTIENRQRQERSNLYTLMPVAQWDVPIRTKKRDTLVPHRNNPSSPQEQGLVPHGVMKDDPLEGQPTKDSHSGTQSVRENATHEEATAEPEPVAPAKSEPGSKGKEEAGLENGKRTEGAEPVGAVETLITEILRFEKKAVTPARLGKHHKQWQRAVAEGYRLENLRQTFAHFKQTARTNSAGELIDRTRTPVGCLFGLLLALMPDVVAQRRQAAEKRAQEAKEAAEAAARDKALREQVARERAGGPPKTMVELFKELQRSRSNGHGPQAAA
jgi:hypothetical protein